MTICIRKGGPTKIAAALAALSGIVLTAGGGYLVALGGRPDDLVMGLASLAAAVMLARDARRGFVLAVAVGFAWIALGLARQGSDPWALLPSLVWPVAVLSPLLLLLPPRRLLIICVAALVLAGGGLALLTRHSAAPEPATSALAAAEDWPAFGGSDTRRFARSVQITPANVAGLTVAWTFRTGSLSTSDWSASQQAVPIKIGNALYLCDASNRVFSLDAQSGRQNWRFDPGLDRTGLRAGRCRGVSYHAAAGAPEGLCRQRIVTTTIDARLFALDALTGRPCEGFGNGGQVNLKDGMGPLEAGRYTQTSVPAIVGDTVVVGGGVSDNWRVGGASGVIRGYDVTTGALRWAWDMARPDRTGIPPAGESYTRGTPNMWTIAAPDPALNQVLIPLGSSTPDFFGAHRTPASERYGTSIAALDAATGRLRWSRQLIHHDIWDLDLPAQPVLTDFLVAGRRVPAVIVPTKTGEFFVFDRRTGAPLTRIEERPVPKTDVPGEFTSPTQPFSVGMPRLGAVTIDADDIWGITPLDRLWCRIRFRRTRYEGPFTPPSLRGSLTMPGSMGGMNWGGATIDAGRNILVANSNSLPIYNHLIPRSDAAELARPAVSPQTGTPFGVQPEPFFSPLGVPCTRPPFGALTAIDLDTRKVLWSRPLGDTSDSGPLGLRLGVGLPMGMPNMGGAITTASGVTFVAATLDAHIRAFETRTGRLLWEAPLPAGGNSIPISYVGSDGRQYIVINAGGHAVLQSRPGDYIVAFALPR